MTDTPLQDDPQDVRDFLQTTGAGMKIIRLQRNNTFRQALSASLADTRDQLHLRNGDASSSKRSFTINVDDLMERIRYFERLTQFQDRVLDGIPHCEVTYESDLQRQDRHQDTANRVFRHLDLDPTPVETRFRKMTPPDLSKIVSNVDEVVEALSESPYAEYLPSTRLS